MTKLLVTYVTCQTFAENKLRKSAKFRKKHFIAYTHLTYKTKRKTEL